MAANKLSRIESMKRCKPIILWIGLVAGVGLVAAGILRSILVLIPPISWNWGTILTILSFLGLFALIMAILGYIFKWDWTGVSGYTPPNKEYQRGKTLWDWLRLLIIPVVLAGGGAIISEQHYKNDQQIAQDQRQENILKTYLDNMSDLVISHNLRNTNADEETKDVARGQTLVAIERLDTGDEKDNMRKGRLLQFLHEAKLIKRNNRVISLQYAHLNGADMSGPNIGSLNTNMDLRDDDLSVLGLNGANLSGGVSLNNADLHNTGLEDAHLDGAYLSGANLRNAFMTGVHLDGANLSYDILSDQTNSIPADLSGAILTKADMSNAIMSNNNLSGTDLRGTNLSDAHLDGAKLQGAKYNTKVRQDKDYQGNPITIQPTQWPKGFNPNAEGAICVDCEKP